MAVLESTQQAYNISTLSAHQPIEVCIVKVYFRYRGSYMSAQVLLNLLNKACRAFYRFSQRV